MKHVIGASIGGLFGFSMPYLMDVNEIEDVNDSRIELLTYGNNSGTEGVHGAIGAYQASSGLWWQDLMIKGNNYHKLSLGRCVVQYHTNGEIGVTGFYDKGTGKANGRDVSEALKWTPLIKTIDMR